MNFRSKVKIEESKNKINHLQKISFIGSCFSHNIGDKLTADEFDVSLNPFGILFNPISIAKAIESCVLQTKILASDLINVGEQWLSLDHHSEFNELSENECLKGINNSIEASINYYNDADYLIITFGSAWVYTYNKTGEIVANCHKIPSDEFTKRLLNVTEIVNSFKHTISLLKEYNPSLQILFTISPVRHWKDGIVENNRSKAILHLAIMEILVNHSQTAYFPSYEIVMDELRDYRFYKSDLLHPNDLAVDYIYEQFSNTFYTSDTKALIERIRRLKSSLSHRPFNPNSESHFQFRESTNQK